MDFPFGSLKPKEKSRSQALNMSAVAYGNGHLRECLLTGMIKYRVYVGVEMGFCLYVGLSAYECLLRVLSLCLVD